MKLKSILISLMCLLLLIMPVAASAEDNQLSIIPAEAGIQQTGIFHFKHLSAQGQVIDEWESKNSLADEGEQFFLDVFLRAATGPTQFYIGLTDSTSTCSITDTSTLTSAAALGEPSTNGYARQLVERSATGWPTLALDSGDYQATSSTETFSASGGSWGPVYCAFLGTTTDGTGKLISYTALSTGRTLADGESLQITYRVKLQ